jgi:hypothetical protein
MVESIQCRGHVPDPRDNRSRRGRFVGADLVQRLPWYQFVDQRKLPKVGQEKLVEGNQVGVVEVLEELDFAKEARGVF